MTIDWISDDITFCMSECGFSECPRNPVNIRCKDIPHSFAMLFGTEYCPMSELTLSVEADEDYDEGYDG